MFFIQVKYSTKSEIQSILDCETSEKISEREEDDDEVTIVNNIDRNSNWISDCNGNNNER